MQIVYCTEFKKKIHCYLLIINCQFHEQDHDLVIVSTVCHARAGVECCLQSQYFLLGIGSVTFLIPKALQDSCTDQCISVQMVHVCISRLFNGQIMRQVVYYFLCRNVGLLP